MEPFIYITKFYLEISTWHTLQRSYFAITLQVRYSDACFLPGTFPGRTKSIVITIFLLFSDKILEGKQWKKARVLNYDLNQCIQLKCT